MSETNIKKRGCYEKRLLIPIFVVLFMTVLSVLPVFAANATASVNSVSAYRGDTVTVTVSEGVTVGSGAVVLDYDRTVLELVTGEWKVSNTMLATFDPSANKGAFAYMTGTRISGKVFSATFKVKSEAAFGATVVKMDLQLKDGSNAALSVTNNSGKVTVNCKHSYSSWSSTGAAQHARICSICQKKDTAAHAYTNACDTSCNTCGYTRTITHSYKTAWSKNSTKHWHECSVCKTKKDEASHTPGPAATETTPQTCATCGYVIQAALGHTHKPTAEWFSDGTTHWHGCATCTQRVEQTPHDYGNTCDTDCNVCGFVRTITHAYATVWSSDQEGHWHACTVCTAKDEVVAHVPGAEATEQAPQLCTVCSYELAPVKEHVHNFTGDQESDAAGHWQVCRCGALSEKEVHAWNEGPIVKEPTSAEAGQKNYTCTSCGYVKEVELELKEVPVVVPDDPDKPHVWDSGEIVKEPTAAKAGQKRYTCTTCGETKIVELELKEVQIPVPDDSVTESGSASPTPPASPGEDSSKAPSDEEHAAQNKEDGTFSIASLLVGALVGAVIGAAGCAVVVLLIGKKKR